MLDRLKPDLVVLSPGPGIPKDFDVSGTLAALEQRGLLWHRSWGGQRLSLGDYVKVRPSRRRHPALGSAQRPFVLATLLDALRR